MQPILDYIARVTTYATPLAIAAIGELVVERTGLVNLGVEGMMALAAAVSVLVGGLTGNPWIGVVAGMAASTLLSLVYRVLVFIGADQIVVGLALVFLGVGLADVVGAYITGPSPTIPSLAGITVVDVAYPLAAVAAYLYLYHTWSGYSLRSIGESPEAARSLGVRVEAYRTAAVIVGGLLAGLAGSYISLTIREGKWFSGSTTGWGWLAIGTVILGYWHPLLVALVSYLEAVLFVSEPFLVTYGLPAPLATMTPYLAVIAALALVSYMARKRGVKPPTQVWLEILR